MGCLNKFVHFFSKDESNKIKSYAFVAGHPEGKVVLIKAISRHWQRRAEKHDC